MERLVLFNNSMDDEEMNVATNLHDFARRISHCAVWSMRYSEAAERSRVERRRGAVAFP